MEFNLLTSKLDLKSLTKDLQKTNIGIILGLLVPKRFLNIPSTPSVTLLEDADVVNQTPNGNSGSSSFMRVSDGFFIRIAYIKFEAVNTSSVTTATLNLVGFIQSGSPPRTVFIREVTDSSWSESTLTFNNSPAVSPTNLASLTLSTAAETSYQVDLTSFVQGKSNSVFTIAIVSNTSAEIRFRTKEHSTSTAPSISLT